MSTKQSFLMGPPREVQGVILDSPRRKPTVTDWIGAVSLAVLALAAILWTVELVRIQQDISAAMDQVEQAVRDLANGMGGLFDTEPQCDPEWEEC